MNALRYKKKYKNFEIRACNRYLLKGTKENPNCTIELVKWYERDGEKFCFALAYYAKTGKEFTLNILEDRFRDYIDDSDYKRIFTELIRAREVLEEWSDANDR